MVGSVMYDYASFVM